MTAVRIEQIAVGRSGLGPATARALVDLLNDDRMPTIGRFNSLGTGDIAPLARLALALPPECARPRRRARADVVQRVDHRPGRPGRDRSGPAAGRRDSGDGADVPGQGRGGGALHPLAAGPFPGPQRVARVLRRLGAGSRHAARLQDQYGLRAAPQTLGIAVDAAATLRDVVTALAGRAWKIRWWSADRRRRWCTTAASTPCT